MAQKFGFVTQKIRPGMDKLMKAGPAVVIVVENIGLIDSLKPLSPSTTFVYRDWMPGQPLDSTEANAKAKVEALKPAIHKSGAKYDLFSLYNEIAQYNLDDLRRFVDFQMECLDQLQKEGVKVVVDGDSTWHPYVPDEWEEFWVVKSQVYAHPAATWRERHEYICDRRWDGGKAGWLRHKLEVAWLAGTGRRVLPHLIGEWGWDAGPSGAWAMKITPDGWIEEATAYRAKLGPEVVGFCYFGAGMENDWPDFDLLGTKAPKEMVDRVVEWMGTAPPGVEEPVRVLLPDGTVEAMEMEEYLKGVLPREMGSGAPTEALKAQAIAARCYAKNAVKWPRHAPLADLCTTTHCQVWSEEHREDCDRAVEETGGVVAFYGDTIINAVYHGHCDGHTRDNEVGFYNPKTGYRPPPVPYMRSVPCVCGFASLYGHGVGMCQRGAMAMASRGATAKEIIKHYYTGAKVQGKPLAYRLVSEWMTREGIEGLEEALMHFLSGLKREERAKP